MCMINVYKNLYNVTICVGIWLVVVLKSNLVHILKLRMKNIF